MPKVLTVANKQLFFVGATAQSGRELWKSDGTPTGTKLVNDLTPGAASSDINVIAAIGNRVIFNFGPQMWTLNSTATSASKLVDLAQKGYTDVHPIIWNNKLYFLANDGIWITDGTLAGSRQFAKLPQSETLYYYGLSNVGSSIIYLYRQTNASILQGLDGFTGKPNNIFSSSYSTIHMRAEGRYLYYDIEMTNSVHIFYTDGKRTAQLCDGQILNVTDVSVGLEACAYNNELYFGGSFKGTGINPYQIGIELYKTTIPGSPSRVLSPPSEIR